MELLRSTAAPPPSQVLGDPAAADGPADDQETEGEGRGDSPESTTAPRKPRRKPAPAAKTKARNIRLSDDVHDRLWLLARQRKQTLSAVANDLLDKTLPKWEVKRQG